MKYFVTVTFLFIASLASAQIVNIPDPVFKQILLNYSPVIDVNHNGEIETSEALAVTNINIDSGIGINSLTGIRAFENLTTLICAHANLLSALDVSGMQNLSYIGFAEGTFTSVNFDGCINLKTLRLPNLTLNDLILNTPKLEILFFEGSNVSITNGLDLTHCDSLNTLQMGVYFYVPIINISGLKKLTWFMGPNFGVNALIARNSGINYLLFPYAPALIDVAGCDQLYNVTVGGSDLASLDLSTCINLKYLSLTCTTLPVFHLNIKNGSMLSDFYFPPGAAANMFEICADDFEIDSIQRIPDFQNPNVLISSYCSFFPGGNYNTIKGKVRADINNNGCDDADAGLTNVPIKITDNSSGNFVIRYTAPSGDYRHYPYAGGFTLNPYFPYPYFNISPTAQTIAFDTANSLIDSANFCISPNGVYNDLDVTLLPTWQRARPGFPATYQLVYINTGTTIQSGNLQLNFDNSKMLFNTASINPVSQNPGQLTWNYANLAPFESRSINISFNLLPPSVNNVGDTLYYLATINPVTGDQTPGNNSFILPQRLRGSFDPNEKECLEGSSLDIAAIDKPLNYVINFQNQGTDTAFNIVVADVLSDKFDWNTVEIIGSSHPCDVEQKNGKIEFSFKNINLPYAAINEPASHGFVAFKVKPKSTLLTGDSLNNKASIYFDFNLPVITNIASTVVNPASPVPVKLEYFSVSKKNETHLLTWKAPSTDAATNFNIERSADGIHFTNIGNITATSQRCELPFNFTDDKPLVGKNYYRLKITGDNGISFYSKVLVIGNNKDDFGIVAITSDDNNTTMYFNSAKQQMVQMKLVAADGKIIYKDSKTIVAGSSKINLPLKNMARGVYTMIVYTNEGATITKRFIK